MAFAQQSDSETVWVTKQLIPFLSNVIPVHFTRMLFPYISHVT